MKGFTLVEFGIVAVVLTVGMLCAGFVAPVQVLFRLLFGWLVQLGRVVTTVSVSWSAVAVCGVGLLLLVALLHGALCRWHQQRAVTSAIGWPLRTTLLLTGLVLTLCASGIGIVGISHQAAWLMTADDSLTHRRQRNPSSPVVGFVQQFFGISTRRTPSRRTQSTNNLKQIGLAMHNSHDVCDSFPTGGTFSQTGRPQHSWVTPLLPFFDQAPLYYTIDLTQPWDADVNKSPMQTVLLVLQRPGMERPSNLTARGYPYADYAGNIHLLRPNAGLRIRDMTDGTSNTLMVGEVNSNFKAWGDPMNWRDPTLGINQHVDGFGSPSPDGAQFLLGDGTVRFLNNSIDPVILKALSTPAGGEHVTVKW